VKPGHSWFPRELQPEQRLEAERLGIPVAIEDVVTGMAMVLVPGGTYEMGASPGDQEALPDEQPRREVGVPPLYVGVAPVLQEQWEKVTGQNPSQFMGTRRPVERVSWDDVQQFAKKMNAGRSGAKLRLPTESEWEYFARAGTTTKYWWGDDYRERMANGRLGGPGETTVVGSYPANPWGLLDVTGNVSEWCQDNHGGGYGQTPTDGKPFEDGGSSRVLRGGSWRDEPWDLRVSYRDDFDADFRFVYVGCRFVRDAVFS
jgi:formylglycine-generating enzyme required for sulfatase activity